MWIVFLSQFVGCTGCDGPSNFKKACETSGCAGEHWRYASGGDKFICNPACSQQEATGQPEFPGTAVPTISYGFSLNREFSGCSAADAEDRRAGNVVTVDKKHEGTALSRPDSSEITEPFTDLPEALADLDARMVRGSTVVFTVYTPDDPFAEVGGQRGRCILSLAGDTSAITCEYTYDRDPPYHAPPFGTYPAAAWERGTGNLVIWRDLRYDAWSSPEYNFYVQRAERNLIAPDGKVLSRSAHPLVTLLPIADPEGLYLWAHAARALGLGFSKDFDPVQGSYAEANGRFLLTQPAHPSNFVGNWEFEITREQNRPIVRWAEFWREGEHASLLARGFNEGTVVHADLAIARRGVIQYPPESRAPWVREFDVQYLCAEPDETHLESVRALLRTPLPPTPIQDRRFPGTPSRTDTTIEHAWKHPPMVAPLVGPPAPDAPR